MTNGEMLRLMSNKDLEEFLANIQFDIEDFVEDGNELTYPSPAKIGAWVKWLEQEVSQT